VTNVVVQEAAYFMNAKQLTAVSVCKEIKAPACGEHQGICDGQPPSVQKVRRSKARNVPQLTLC